MKRREEEKEKERREEEKKTKEERKKRRRRKSGIEYLYGTCKELFGTCMVYFELVFFLEYFLWYGIFPLVWITSMDTSWNPCLCKGFFLPWNYVPFRSHLWLCRSPRGCLVFFPEPVDRKVIWLDAVASNLE